MAWLWGGGRRGINKVVCMKAQLLQYWKWRFRKNRLFSWGYSTSYSLITDLETEANRVHMCICIKLLVPPLDALEPRCWRRLLRVPWKARRSNQAILREINPEYSLEERMLKLKLKLQYLGPPDAKNWLTGKDHNAGKDWRQKEKGTEDEMVG